MVRSLDIVVPVFNEETSIEHFHKSMEEVVKKIKKTTELEVSIIFVDDGSHDRTVESISTYFDSKSVFKNVEIIKLSRNFGKELALASGLKHSIADALVVIDVDLQDPPELIIDFIKKWDEGYDVVYGMRKERQSDSFMKRNTAKLFYLLFNFISNSKIPYNTGDFRLITKKVVKAINTMNEQDRFMKGIFAWVGFKSIGISYTRSRRIRGDSKWGVFSLFRLALDGFFSFSTVPLVVWSWVGAMVALLGFLYACFIVFNALITENNVPGYASLMAVSLVFNGLILLSIGILGSYVARIMKESKGRPLYIVDDVLIVKK